MGQAVWPLDFLGKNNLQGINWELVVFLTNILGDLSASR